MARHQYVGDVYGWLTIITEAGIRLTPRGKSRRVVARCRCGTEFEVSIANIRAGRTKSCGCMTSALCGLSSTRHGMNKTPEHTAWVGMRQRCMDPNCGSYHDYGARGIRICERWELFENFYADMGSKPSPSHSLDRIDNDGDYEPGNVRWATRSEQARNRRSSKVLVVRGEPKTLAEWSETKAINYSTIQSRLGTGWSVERALTTPVTRDRA